MSPRGPVTAPLTSSFSILSLIFISIIIVDILQNAKVVDISYGANIPQLFEYCSKYIEIFRDPSQDSMLTLYEFDELLPAEKAAIEHQIREEEVCETRC